MNDVQSYCDTVVAELSVWKAKIYDVIRRVDQAPSGAKAKIGDQVNDLHMFVQDLENRINKLRTECPADWKADRIEMENKFDYLKGKMNDIHANFSPGDIGG